MYLLCSDKLRVVISNPEGMPSPFQALMELLYDVSYLHVNFLRDQGTDFEVRVQGRKAGVRICLAIVTISSVINSVLWQWACWWNNFIVGARKV